MLRQLLQCLDIPIESRSAQPALAQLHTVKTALSGPANPPPASLPGAAQLPASQLMSEHLSPQLYPASGKQGVHPAAAASLVQGQQVGQHASPGLFISGPAQSPSKPMSPLRVAPLEGAYVAQGAQQTGSDAQANDQRDLPADQHTAEMGPPPPRSGRPTAAPMLRPGKSTACAAANAECTKAGFPAPALGNAQKDLPAEMQLIAPQQRLHGSRSTVQAQSAQQGPPAGACARSALAPLGGSQQIVAPIASEFTRKPEGVPEEGVAATVQGVTAVHSIKHVLELRGNIS